MALLRSRRGALVFAAAIAALALGVAVIRVRIEDEVRARIEAGAARRGLQARVRSVRVGVWPPLRLADVELESVGHWRLDAREIEGWWPGHARLKVGPLVVTAPAGLAAEVRPTTWDVEDAPGGGLRLELREPKGRLVVTRSRDAEGDAWTLDASELPAGEILDIRRSDRPLLSGGTVTGSLRWAASSRAARFDVDASAVSARLPALAGGGPEDAPLGEPTDLALQVVGCWSRAEGTLEVPRWSARLDGASLSGSLSLKELGTSPAVDLSLDVERLDFARLLRTSGVAAPGAAGGDDLGSAALSASARGRVSEPSSFVVAQHLDFTPPRRMPPAIERLRGPFVHVVASPGVRKTIDVSPASPDFIPLQDVPPLFLRTLLLGEDAGFYGHPGIDLRELPSALLTNWARGGAARGASTITQQLAKNLFLTGEKRLGRKLQELSLALLLESALGKERILEIYVNVIEWGPGLYGLRPAARVYFDREPGQLTPAQMAFLVSLIPGPVKYQSSFAHGILVPGFRQLVDALLAKLRSVEALTEEEYQQALLEEIVVVGRERAQGPERLNR